MAESAGIEFKTVTDFFIGKTFKWSSQENLGRITKIVRTMKKPMVFYCRRAYAATFMMLLYFSQETKAGNMDVPQVRFVITKQAASGAML